MNYTKADEVEHAVTKFAELVAGATLNIVEDPKSTLSDREAKAFATGVMCVVDGMRHELIPTLRKIVKENPRFFENLN